MNIWEQSFEDLRRPHLEEKKGDGNLANNYPPYDTVTRGDVIAGATGKDQMGGKKKMMKKEHSDWRSDLGFFTEEDCECDGPIKPKKGIKNKVTINPDLKTEENISENPLVGLGIKAGLAAGTALAGKMVYDKAKGVAGKLQQRNQQTQKAIDSLKNSYEPEGEEISEREMTSGEMKKEKNLKKKYDDSGMKASMKKQYGAEKGKQIYFATIRKKAMEELEIDEAKQTFPMKKVAGQMEKARKGSVYGRDGGTNSIPTDTEKKNTTRFSKMFHASEKAKREKQNADKASRSSTFYKDTHPASAPKMKKKNEEFAGNYEGPLYAPHPDIEEAYKEIDKDKENKMYRRAGNLARTALSSTGKKKAEAQKKSSNIVSAITRQKEKERFDRIGQSPKHNEAVENELDYYLGEALRPASERMKRVQTDAGRKKQEKERERKSKLEAEADKILAGFSKKGTGLAKTKPMSERREMDEPGERDTNPDVKRHNKMVGYRPRPKRPSVANDPRYGTVQDRSGKFKY